MSAFIPRTKYRTYRRVKDISHRSASCGRERLDARIEAAQRGGDFGYINREYERRRIEACERGESFMPYSAAQARLRKALAGVAAGDRPVLMTRVFRRGSQAQ